MDKYETLSKKTSDLAFEAAHLSNDAYDQLEEARNAQAKLEEISALAIEGVIVSPTATADAEAKVGSAKATFDSLCDMAGSVLLNSNTEPNIRTEKPETPTLEQTEASAPEPPVEVIEKKTPKSEVFKTRSLQVIESLIDAGGGVHSDDNINATRKVCELAGLTVVQFSNLRHQHSISEMLNFVKDGGRSFTEISLNESAIRLQVAGGELPVHLLKKLDELDSMKDDANVELGSTDISLVAEQKTSIGRVVSFNIKVPGVIAFEQRIKVHTLEKLDFDTKLLLAVGQVNSYDFLKTDELRRAALEVLVNKGCVPKNTLKPAKIDELISKATEDDSIHINGYGPQLTPYGIDKLFKAFPSAK